MYLQVYQGKNNSDCIIANPQKTDIVFNNSSSKVIILQCFTEIASLIFSNERDKTLGLQFIRFAYIQFPFYQKCLPYMPYNL